MENLINLIQLLNKTNSPQQEKKQIPKEVLDQYPYGEFPSRYTRTGQENIRKNSENRFSYITQAQEEQPQQKQQNLDIQSLLPLLSLFNQKGNSQDMLKTLTKLLFKDNPELQKIFEFLPNHNKESKNKNDNDFPDLNKVSINSLKKVK